MNPGTMVAIHAATAAAAASKARTKVLDTFRTHDATAPTRARRLADIGLAGDDAVARLIQDGVIRPVDSRGRLTVLGESIDRVAGYYLDEAAYIVNRDGADRASSRKGVLLACAAVVVAAGAALVILASVNR
jgi:hypothetical protein